MTKTKIKVVKAEPKKFKLSLDLGDLHYETKADSVVEAIVNLSIDRFKIRGYGLFTLKDGKKKAELKYTPFQMRRLLINQTARNLFERNILIRLK